MNLYLRADWQVDWLAGRQLDLSTIDKSEGGQVDRSIGRHVDRLTGPQIERLAGLRINTSLHD